MTEKDEEITRPDVLRSQLPNAPKVLLIVDDEPMVRKVLATMLTDEGYDVITAEDDFSAISVASSYADEIALALVDYRLPGMTGGALLFHLLELRPKMKVIFVTGYPHVAKYLGYPVIEKPFNVNEVRALIKKVLGTAQ